MKKFKSVSSQALLIVIALLVIILLPVNYVHADSVTDNAFNFLKSKQDSAGKITTGFSAPTPSNNNATSTPNPTPSASPSPIPTVLPTPLPIIKINKVKLTPSPTSSPEVLGESTISSSPQPTSTQKSEVDQQQLLINGFKSTALPIAGTFGLFTTFKFLEGRRWKI